MIPARPRIEQAVNALVFAAQVGQGPVAVVGVAEQQGVHGETASGNCSVIIG